MIIQNNSEVDIDLQKIGFEMIPMLSGEKQIGVDQTKISLSAIRMLKKGKT